MIKALFILGAFIGGIILLQASVDNWSPCEYKSLPERDIGSFVTQKVRFINNEYPYKTDIQFKLYVFKKIDHLRLDPDIKENPRWIYGHTIDQKIIIRYAIVYLKQ